MKITILLLCGLATTRVLTGAELAGQWEFTGKLNELTLALHSFPGPAKASVPKAPERWL